MTDFRQFQNPTPSNQISGSREDSTSPALHGGIESYDVAHSADEPESTHATLISNNTSTSVETEQPLENPSGLFTYTHPIDSIDPDIPSFPVGRYSNVGEPLGFGNRSIVMIVRDAVKNRYYAKKSIQCTKQNFQERKAAFRLEIKILRDLSNDADCSRHRVTILEDAYIDEERRTLHLLMSPVADASLRELFEDTYQGAYAIRPTGFHHYFLMLADGLNYLHRKFIRHKDIKPENILEHDDRLLYSDFGISRNFNGTSMTTEGPEPEFTWAYAAPEVIERGRRSEKSDVFSLGAVFYEILAWICEMEEFQDKVYGKEGFRGYWKMSQNGFLQSKIRSRQQQARSKAPTENADGRWDCVEYYLFNDLGHLFKMLYTDEHERPSARELHDSLEQTTAEHWENCEECSEHYSRPWTPTATIVNDRKRLMEIDSDAVFREWERGI